MFDYFWVHIIHSQKEGLFKFSEFVDDVSAAAQSGAAACQSSVACFHFSQSLIMARKLACPVRFPIGTVLQPLSSPSVRAAAPQVYRVVCIGGAYTYTHIRGSPLPCTHHANWQRSYERSRLLLPPRRCCWLPPDYNSDHRHHPDKKKNTLLLLKLVLLKRWHSCNGG